MCPSPMPPEITTTSYVSVMKTCSRMSNIPVYFRGWKGQRGGPQNKWFDSVSLEINAASLYITIACSEGCRPLDVKGICGGERMYAYAKSQEIRREVNEMAT